MGNLIQGLINYQSDGNGTESLVRYAQGYMEREARTENTTYTAAEVHEMLMVILEGER